MIFCLGTTEESNYETSGGGKNTIKGLDHPEDRRSCSVPASRLRHSGVACYVQIIVAMSAARKDGDSHEYEGFDEETYHSDE